MSVSGGASIAPNGSPSYTIPSGQSWYPIGQALPGTVAGPPSALRLCPVYVPPISISGIGLEVTVAGNAGTTIRPALYADNGNGYPGALFLDPGTLAGDAVALPVIALGTPSVWPGGVMWLGAARQGVTGTNPTMRALGYDAYTPAFALAGGVAAGDSYQCLNLAGVAGALPATAAGALPATVACPRLFLTAT